MKLFSRHYPLRFSNNKYLVPVRIYCLNVLHKISVKEFFCVENCWFILKMSNHRHYSKSLQIPKLSPNTSKYIFCAQFSLMTWLFTCLRVVCSGKAGTNARCCEIFWTVQETPDTGTSNVYNNILDHLC